MEVKSGKARLNEPQRALRNAVEAGKVRWFEYRIPEELVKKKRE